MPTLGYGIEIRAGANAAAATATVLLGECTEIPAPSFERDAVEVTAHDSANGYRRYIPGLRNTGELSIALNVNPGDATHDLLLTMQGVAMNAQADWFFEITYAQMAGTPRCSFRAFVIGFEADGPVESQVTGTLTLRPINVPAWTGV